MRLRFAVALVLLPVLAGVGPARAQEHTPNDYGDPDTWLCRPDRTDACSVDLSTTWVTPEGDVALERWSSDPYAPIDCFYVYPTVSNDPTANSDMDPGPGETGVVRSQFARFGGACKPYAPLYRQFTLTALRSRMSGGEMTLDRDLGYDDVVDAWNYYVEHDNNGRGVVLIGHSQGASVLLRMIGEEIDGKPIQESVVSAILLGTNVQVPEGKDVGGSFQHMPLCRSTSQTGCIVTFSTYRATRPPDRTSLFGRGQGARSVAGCTNPAALEGGPAHLRSYFGVGDLPDDGSWVTGGPEIGTGFVSTPGLLTGECVRVDGFSYLEITVNGDPADGRTDEIAGDVMLRGEPSAAWGLHLIDVSVAMGDLVTLVRQQGEALLGNN